MTRINKQNSPLTDVMEYYDAEMTRDEYVLTNFVGEVAQDSFIPLDVEATFPVQFKRRTLLDTPSASNSAQ
jgi:hypothetical protein